MSPRSRRHCRRACPSIVSSASSRTCFRRTRGSPGSRRRRRPPLRRPVLPPGPRRRRPSVPNVTIQGATYSHQSVARVLARLAALPDAVRRPTHGERSRRAGSAGVRGRRQEEARSRSRSPSSRSRSPRAFGRVVRHEGAHRRSSSACRDRDRRRRRPRVRARALVPARLTEASRGDDARRRRHRGRAAARRGARVLDATADRRHASERRAPSRKGDAVERRPARPRPRARPPRTLDGREARLDHSARGAS